MTEMSPLPTHDMTVRNMSPATQRSSIRAVATDFDTRAGTRDRTVFRSATPEKATLAEIASALAAPGPGVGDG